MSPLLALPPVDGVEITTIMDNSLDLLMSSTPVARRFPLPLYGFMRHQLRAEHGVSLLITIIDQGKRETILFDTGVTPDGALHNLQVLGIDRVPFRRLSSAMVIPTIRTDWMASSTNLAHGVCPSCSIQMPSSSVVLSITIRASLTYHLRHTMTWSGRG